MDKRCRCEPCYVARVWDPTRHRSMTSPSFRSPHQAVDWLQATKAAFREGSFAYESSITVNTASKRFLEAAKGGIARNKKGQPYKKSTLKTIEGALNGRIKDELGSLRLAKVRRGHVQKLVDGMVADELSGSRVRNVLNGLRSLYSYAIARDLAQDSPVRHIQLPAINETPRNRIATPLEFQALMRVLEPADTVPFALAAYATARCQEILNLTWSDVYWNENVIYLASNDAYEKTVAAKRTVPLIPQLHRVLKDAFERQGNPAADQLVCPPHKPGGRNSGKLHPGALYHRADEQWAKSNLDRIRLHECRHTAASWMRAAGIDLKVRSVLMGHASTASTDLGAGSITDDRYTHLLPGEIQRAGNQLSKYLTTREKSDGQTGPNEQPILSEPNPNTQNLKAITQPTSRRDTRWRASAGSASTHAPARDEPDRL